MAAFQGSLGGTSVKEAALGPPGASPAPSSFGAPKRKQNKSAVKQAAEASTTPPLSTHVIKNNSIQAEEVPTSPLSEVIMGKERDRSLSPHTADTFLEVLQEQNRDLARESMTLRRALLQHISQEQLLSLLSGISADAPAPAPVENNPLEVVKEPPLSADGAEAGKARAQREKHIYQPCVREFFRVLSCCGGTSVETSPFMSFEESDAPGSATRVRGRQAVDEDTLQLPQGPQRNTSDKLEREKNEEHEESPISVDFFPLGSASEDAATQIKSLPPKSLQTQDLESPTPSGASSVDKLSSLKRGREERQDTSSAPRVSLETFRPREGPQRPSPNYEIECASQNPFNLPCTFPLASLLPQSPYANPCLLPLVAFNGDPLWVVSRIRETLRNTLRASSHPQEVLERLWIVWREYLHQLSALKKTVDAALILHKYETKNNTRDAGVQVDSIPTETASSFPESSSLPQENEQQTKFIQRGSTGALGIGSHEEPERTCANPDGEAEISSVHSGPEATKKEEKSTQPLRTHSREPSRALPSGVVRRLRKPSSLAIEKPSRGSLGQTRIS
ncbi:hypothetical protein Emed_006943 [Eimeria media]